MGYMKIAVAWLLFVVVLSGCSVGDKSGETAVPRRHAYPRIDVPDSAFTFIETGYNGMQLSLNDATEYALHSSDDGTSNFIDVDYPGLNAAIYFTITPVERATLPDVIDNRLERVSLNLGGADAELLEFDSPAGFENKVFVSRADISTPVQFIATDGETTVISGTSFLKDASAANADSLAPVVNMLRRDILHSLKTLHR